MRLAQFTEDGTVYLVLDLFTEASACGINPDVPRVRVHVRRPDLLLILLRRPSGVPGRVAELVNELHLALAAVPAFVLLVRREISARSSRRS